MNGSELYERWAPGDGAWSPWVKPVLFATEYVLANEEREAWRAAVEGARGRFSPPREADTALVIDLPGPEALALSLECARGGYRPVPLFNSCLGAGALVANEVVRGGLELGAAALAEASPPAEGPPAFVLDARRLTGVPRPVVFDNRWCVFPQDFPSANALLARSIRRVVLVQAGRLHPLDDLAHVLLRWQRSGIVVEAVDLASDAAAPTEIEVRRPPWFRALFQRLLVSAGLRRSSAGGFGAIVPQQASGAGGVFA